MIARLLFRLLPIRILPAAAGSVNGIVSGFFAGNFVGVDATSAVGRYDPVKMFLSSVSLILVVGSSILCGKYMGRNQQDEMQGVFSLNLVVSLLIAAALTALYLPIWTVMEV